MKFIFMFELKENYQNETLGDFIDNSGELKFFCSKNILLYNLKDIMIKLLTYLTLLALASSLAADPKSQLMTFAEKHCIDCHDEDISKGDVRFDVDFSKNNVLLEKAFLQVRSGDMPPPKKNKMTAVERAQLTKILAGSVHHHSSNELKRLTKLEFVNSLQDLLDIKIQASWVASIPEDSGKGEFNTIGNLGFSETHLKYYLDAVNLIVDKALRVRKPTSKEYISSKFIYEKHAKRKKIDINAPSTNISTQPRTAKGLSFPYFRDGFVCEKEGYYEISYTASSKTSASLMVFADTYYQDGALVNKEPRLVDVRPISKKKEHKFVAYLKKGNELGFSVLTNESVDIMNPVKINGPIIQSWPPKRISKLFPGLEVKVNDNSFKLLSSDSSKLVNIVSLFAKRAFRKQVSKEEAMPFVELAESYYKVSGDLLASAKEAFKAILSSPQFLYHHQLNKNIKIANRMSYFLWRSTPDNDLLSAAYKNNSDNQIGRMINSPKVKRLIDDFTFQWLDLKHIYKSAPDFRLYPEYDPLLNRSFDKETKGFMMHLYNKDLPLSNLIDSDFLIINNQLAKLYKIPGVQGPQFRLVKKPEGSVRGGIITQAAVMTATADGASTTPVKRGVWLAERILGKKIPLPPKNVAGIEPDLSSSKTVLQKLDAHRDNKACRSCHTRIDPFGVAFESFDPIGQYRKNYRVLAKGARSIITFRAGGQHKKGALVDTKYSMADGRTYKDIHELKNILLEDFHMVHRSFVHKLYEFALGRELTAKEILESDEFSKAHTKSGFKTLLTAMVQSDLFRGEK